MLPETWVSFKEVARDLGVAEDRSNRWAEARRIPSHEVGRCCKFKLHDVDGWIRSGGASELARTEDPE
jgi:excisionase family DNA binding protein